MYSFRVLLTLGLLLAGGGLHAQSTGPTTPIATTISAQTLVAGGEALTLYLPSYFGVANLKATSLVQFDTTKGKFNVQLFGNDAPKTVVNFQTYVLAGSYTNSLVHRSQSNFVIQGGGFFLNGTSIDPIVTQAAVQNEYKLPNIRGTLAMAKTATGPDTATSQWFVNLADNTTALGTSNNGGFTVFGQVLGTGMTVVDAIAAVPTYDKSTQLGSAFNQLPLLDYVLGHDLTTGNLVLVNSMKPVAIYPDVAGTLSVLSFTGGNSNPAVVTATLHGPTLILKPLAEGSSTVTLRATDTNGNNSDDLTFGVIVVAAPAFTTQPISQGVALGADFTVTAAATGSPAFQWQLNGGNIAGGTTPGINVKNFQATYPGLFVARATVGNAVAYSNPAIVGLAVPAGVKVVGSGTEVLTDVHHPNGNIYDQVLLQDAGAGITADFSPDPAQNQVTRISYIDLNDDIVQIEYSGPGTLSLVLESPTAPAKPAKYNQDISYMKGRARIIITGANEYSNVSVFSVGRNNAVNQALFKNDVTYDGVADIGLIAIASTNGKFGGVRTANARYSNTSGYTGVYAPGVSFQGPVYVNNINAFSTAKPVLVLGSAAGDVLVSGGNLEQSNGQSVKVSGITKLQFKNGVDSHGNGLAAQLNKAVLVQDGNDVTTQIVVNPLQ